MQTVIDSTYETNMRSSFIQSILLLLFFQCVVSIPVAWSEGLPSQTERFKGMSSTFKEKVNMSKAAEAAAKAKQLEEEKQRNEANAKPVNYFKLHIFVVNVTDKRFSDKILLLTLDLYCEIQNLDDKSLIDTHIAPIKDSIITYLSGIDRQEIQTPKQKKSLQNDLTQRVSDVLLKLTGKKVVSGLYITRMIIK